MSTEKQTYIDSMYSSFDKVRAHDYYNKANNVVSAIGTNPVIYVPLYSFMIILLIIFLSGLAKCSINDMSHLIWLIIFLVCFCIGAFTIGAL